jgi:DNA polymerase III subunit theta
MQNRVFNLSALSKEGSDLIEVDKAAAYAVWKERKGDLAKAEEDIKSVDDKYRAQFLAGLTKYRAIKG